MVAGATLTSENFGRLLYETRVRAMGHSVVTRADAQSPRAEHGGEEEEARLLPALLEVQRRVKFPRSAPQRGSVRARDAAPRSNWHRVHVEGCCRNSWN